jgi:flagellar basal body-associated protein FliL
MKKILNPKILIPIVATLLLSGVTAYILLAPDTWWKPIYVQFETEELSANENPASTEVLKEEAVTHSVSPTSDNYPSQKTPLDKADLKPTTDTPHLVMPAIQPGQGVMYKLDPKVVNLADPGGLRYLQTNIVLEFHPTVKEYYEAKVSEETSDHASGHSTEVDTTADPFQEAIDTLRPIIDDIVTTLLSSKTFNEVSTIDGKLALKEELMSKINTALGYPGVINAYFTDFIVQ